MPSDQKYNSLVYTAFVTGIIISDCTALAIDNRLTRCKFDIETVLFKVLF